MPRADDDDRPLLWATNARSRNVVVLSDRAVYVGTAGGKDLARIDAGLEQGDPPDELLDRPEKILLRRITRFTYRHSPMYALADVTVHYERDGTERSAVLALGDVANRDAFVSRLNARLGDWPAAAEARHPAFTVLKYVGILSVVLFFTALIAVLEWMGVIESGPAPLILCLDFCGVWGIFAAGVVAFVFVLGIGIYELITPIRTVTHEPED
jgi:hypothetical protein